MFDYTKTRKAAYSYRKAGLSVIPIGLDGDKRPDTPLLPDGKWKPFSSRLPAKQQMEQMFPGDRPQGVAILGGEVSGGLEIIDVDDGQTWQEFKSLVEKECPELLDRIPQVESPRDGGGRHLYVWSDQCGGNTKLARNEDGQTLIEVKGEGGYCLAPGCHAQCHATGREYRHVGGPPITDKPRLTDQERTILFACADSLNRYVPEDRPARSSKNQKQRAEPNSPGNIFMRVETFASTGLLEKHGWTKLGQYGERIAWRRPGKTTPGFSALSGPDRFGHDRLTVFSTSAAPLEGTVVIEDENGQKRELSGCSYNLFQAYAVLKHRGKFDRAALHLADEGYTPENHPKTAVDDHIPITQPLPTAPVLWQPFPVDLLPQPCADLVWEISRVTSCDPALAAVMLLGAIGGAVNNRRAIRLRSDYIQPGIIWTGVIAPSGSVKTPIWRAVVKYLRALQEQAFSEYFEQFEEYEEDREDYARRRKRWEKNPDDADRPEKPEKPICRRFLVHDTTIEKLIVILQQNPQGVLLARDELSGWISGFNEYKSSKGGDESRWLEIWNGDSITVDRKHTDEPIHVPRAAVSITGGIQPDVFRRVIDQRHYENGMVQRVLWAMPPLGPIRWQDDEISKKVEHRMRRLFEELTALEMDETETGPVPVMVDVSDEAMGLWKTWYDDLGRRVEEVDTALRAAWTKLHLFCARFALVLHLIKQATGEEDQQHVSAQTMEQAIGLAEWFVHETRRVYTAMRAKEDDLELVRVAEFIARHGGQTAVRNLVRNYSRVEKDKDRAEQLLSALEKQGWGEWHTVPPGKKGGRPSRRFVLRTDKTDKTSGHVEPCGASDPDPRKNGSQTDKTPNNAGENEVLSVPPSICRAAEEGNVPIGQRRVLDDGTEEMVL